MVAMSRFKAVLSVTLLTCCLAFSGCLHSGVEPPLASAAGGSQPAVVAQASHSVVTNPAGTLSASAIPADLKQSNYTPQASFTGQAMPVPGQPAMEEPGLGAPIAGATILPNPPLPTELNRNTHPPHRVAPPDILFIEASRLVPRGPYKVEPMEVLQIEVVGVFKDQIKGLYMISPEGTINLGHTLRPIPVAGLTVDRVQNAIVDYLRQVVKGDMSVSVALVQMRGMQAIRGEHLVRPDGTISLGMYGSVYVAGMTLGQVKCVIEKYLSAYLVDPQIAVDVFAYNSRKIYIVADGAGYGQQVIALPATGGETVLDAISRVQGLPPVASLKKIWVARPSPAGHPCSQVLPVNWKAITQGGRTETNYQLLPGDRIYIASDPMVCAYNYLDKFLAPIERVLGVTLLGTSVYRTIQGNNNGAGLIIAR